MSTLKKDPNEEFGEGMLTGEQKIIMQSMVMMLIRSVIEEKVAVHLYKDVKTGRVAAVIGRQEQRPDPKDAKRTEISFTPLGRMFIENPGLEVEPLMPQTQSEDHPIVIETDGEGNVMNIKDIENFTGFDGVPVIGGVPDKSKLN